MTMKQGCVFASAVLLAGLLGAAPKGSCESEAISISGQATFTLGPEYVDGVKQDWGACYYKATLRRGMAYTVYTSGITTNMTVRLDDLYPAESTKESQVEPGAGFEEVDERDGNQRYVMSADEWYIDDEDPAESDPASWTYYFRLRGTIGEKGTIMFVQGVSIPRGRSQNQDLISPSTTPQTVSERKLEINGEYYFRARLQAGRLYHFATSQATETMPLGITIEPYDDEDDLEVPLIVDDPVYNDQNDSGVYIVPRETGTYSIVVTAPSSEDDQKPFGLTHVLYAYRDIDDHPFVELNAANGYTADFNAGSLMAPGSKFYDEIIDECLFRFTAAKGARYVVSATGAKTNLLMRVYDAKGTILKENLTDGLGGFDVRAAVKTTAAGIYYVGVCQRQDDPISVPASYQPVTIRLEDATATDGQPDEWDADDDVPAGATPLSPLPGRSTESPAVTDPAGTGWHRLGMSDWCDTFVIAARKGVTYRLIATVEDPSATANNLMVDVFTLSGTTERAVPVSGGIDPESKTPLTFTATANQAYYLRLSVAEGEGLDFPSYKLHASAYQEGAAALGILTVNTHGSAAATWTLDSETVKYPGGSSVLVSGSHTVKFGTVAGFKAPAVQKVDVVSGKKPTVVDGYYIDTFDPRDDRAAGATAWTLKNVPLTMTRTLWADDPEDNFAFASADGCYYDFALKAADCDAVFSITNAQLGVLAENVTSVSRLVVPKTSPKTYLVVKHAENAKSFGGYELTGSFANVGAIRFARDAISVKENAASVAVTVNRTAKDGVVRVEYGTVAGTAKPGIDYVPQTGVLEWAANDNKAKVITIALIPDLVEVYEGNKTFGLKIRPIDEADLTPGEYEAAIAGRDTCLITLTEASRPGTTVASAYAAKAPKPATVRTEAVALETGSFTALLHEDGSALTNGLPRLASVTFTASTANPAALSAKVMLAGKTYTFAGKGWDEGVDDATLRKDLELVQRVNNVTYTNVLSLTVAKGRTDDPDAWQVAGGEVELTMNVPDANNKGVQEEIRYTGELFRNNAKIQDYLMAVTNFTGYYTIALDPGSFTSEGVPAGNGYLTLTVDNKGTVRVAGMLADGTTRPSLSAAACAIRPDKSSANGYAMYVPVYLAKAPVCFGGVLRLYAVEDPDQPSGAATKVVVDASRPLVWNNDNPATTYYNEEGYRLEPVPCGGWYDTVFNLQTYYLTHALSVGAADISEFPTEALPAGYVYSTEAEPNGFALGLAGNNVTYEKKKVVKSGMLTDLAASSNPCNVAIKVARATGLVTGSCSLWSVSEDGLRQKEMTGLKVFGVMVQARDPFATLTDEIIAPGFVTQSVRLTDYNETTNRTTTRSWTFSAPFNVVGENLGDIDWWADDWGDEFGE